MKKLLISGLALSVLAVSVSYADKAPKETTKWAPAVQPKALQAPTKTGLNWLLEHQNKDGGWGQGEESAAMRQGNGPGDNLAYQSNVADTSAACLALIRAGYRADKEPALANGIGYVCGQIEQADNDSLAVTSIRGTRVQMKLGPYIDTFMANMLLAEAKGTMPDDKSEKRLLLCLDKVVHKIEKNQKSDGSYSNEGWAPVLAQSIATKGLNRAAQNGVVVNAATLEKSEGYAQGQFDAGKGTFKSAPGDAGVALYSTAAAVSGMSDSVNTNAAREQELKHKVATAKDAKERDDAQRGLDQLERGRQAQGAARKAVVGRLDDKQFLSGFGSNGGEEFLSYMNISESLVVQGGPEWEKWDSSMAENLGRIQNPDGSWSGHHCITGKTFCTAAALLVLTADRAPVPVALRK